MKALNFGSLNLDYVYEVDHFVQPGETLSALRQTVNPGGKGLNQSIALARAGRRSIMRVVPARAAPCSGRRWRSPA